MSEYYVPALTTIRQDRRQLGRRAAEVLLKRLSGAGGVHAPEAAIPVELVIRASTATPPD
jgi:LacI family repressor for deo operon, udp, cdd, tsx, nupC, and nupG